MEATMLNDLHDYFLAVAVIWDSFASGQIGVAKREALLRPLRAQLPSLPVSSLAAERNLYSYYY
jgi:hypothetical protein